jgi:hypothetical protein
VVHVITLALSQQSNDFFFRTNFRGDTSGGADPRMNITCLDLKRKRSKQASFILRDILLTYKIAQGVQAPFLCVIPVVEAVPTMGIHRGGSMVFHMLH